MNKKIPWPAVQLRERREAVHKRAAAGDLDLYPERCAHIVDLYFQERLADYPKLSEILQASSFALVAVGGYGRRELCPASDIDVLLLFQKKIPGLCEDLSSWLYHPLWDLGLDLGHGVRNFADCISLAAADYQVLASLLDLRFIAGDKRVAHRFQDLFARKILARKRSAFAAWLAETNVRQESAFGDSSGLLQPDLKNGIGALRGVHQIGWCGAVLASDPKWTDPLTEQERTRLHGDNAFLLRTRTALHITAGRPGDVLHFGLQPRVAELLGYTPAQGSFATASPRQRAMCVERFLSELHQAMARIKSLRSAFWLESFPPRFGRTKSLAPGVTDGPRGLCMSPSMGGDAVLQLFRQAAATGRPLSLSAMRAVRNVLERDVGLAPGKENLAALLAVARAPHALHAMRTMLETGVLSAILPGMGRVEHLVQFDDYHVHAVGRHTVETVGRLATLLRGEDQRFRRIAERIEKPDRLLLAALFHDLGKGEGDHSDRGARQAGNTLSKMGIDPETASEVAFLVRHHLLVPTTATRKDLSDERVVGHVAETAETTQRLDMLYLLSVADSMATGPRAWSAWTGSLMRELYSKAWSMLAEGPLAGPDSAVAAKNTRKEALRLAGREHGDEFARRCLEKMPPRAFQALAPDDIARHMGLVKRLHAALEEDAIRTPGKNKGVGVCVLQARPTGVGSTYEVSIAAKDRPGLFATLAGVLALHQLDILAADLFTWKDKTVVDVFVVDSPPDKLYVEEVFERVRRAAHYAFLGKLSLGYRLGEMRRSPLHGAASTPDLPPVVRVDNEASDFHTLVEVAAPDRLGLLYDIAAALANMYVEVHLAKITTDAGRVADVFHVLASDGRKLDDPGLVRQVEDALLTVVSPGSGSGPGSLGQENGVKSW